MPKVRPGVPKYVVATKVVLHDMPCTENGFVGVSVKQRAVSSGQGATGRQSIAIGESFIILTKGQVEVPTIVGATKGAGVWIRVATNALVLADAGAGDIPFGTIAELPGERGGRTTHMRVDLDDKDFGFAAA